MVLLGGKALVEARFSPFADSTDFDAIGALFAPNVP
jgi:hypothetical protein